MSLEKRAEELFPAAFTHAFVAYEAGRVRVIAKQLAREYADARIEEARQRIWSAGFYGNSGLPAGAVMAMRKWAATIVSSFATPNPPETATEVMMQRSSDELLAKTRRKLFDLREAFGNDPGTARDLGKAWRLVCELTAPLMILDSPPETREDIYREALQEISRMGQFWPNKQESDAVRRAQHALKCAEHASPTSGNAVHVSQSPEGER